MNGVLWLETPCEHGEIERHSLGWDCSHPDDGKPHDINDSGVCKVAWCPGGSRRRVTVDYEKGAEALTEYLTGRATATEIQVGIARSVVDAALQVEE